MLLLLECSALDNYMIHVMDILLKRLGYSWLPLSPIFIPFNRFLLAGIQWQAERARNIPDGEGECVVEDWRVVISGGLR